MNNSLEIFRYAVVENNLILLQGLGLLALTRLTKTTAEASRVSLAILGSMLTAGMALWALAALVPSGYALDWPFLLLIAGLSALLWQRIFAYQQNYLLSSAVVGMALIGGRDFIGGPQIVTFAFAAGLGVSLVLLVVAAIRERLDLCPVPQPFRGIPIVLLTTGLLALALLGFKF